MEWVAYCLFCDKVLTKCPNGNFANSAGEVHREITGHNVLVGYFAGEQEKEKED